MGKDLKGKELQVEFLKERMDYTQQDLLVKQPEKLSKIFS